MWISNNITSSSSDVEGHYSSENQFPISPPEYMAPVFPSLPMGRDFVGLARALRWVGLGSLGRAHYKASWAGSGRESAKPRLPSQPSESFLPYIPEVLNTFELRLPGK